MQTGNESNLFSLFTKFDHDADDIDNINAILSSFKGRNVIVYENNRIRSYYGQLVGITYKNDETIWFIVDSDEEVVFKARDVFGILYDVEGLHIGVNV